MRQYLKTLYAYIHIPYNFEWSKIKSRPIAHQVSGSSRKHTESLMTCFFRAESGIWRNPILSIMNAWNLPHEDWPDCLQTCPRKMNSKLWLTRFSGRGRERQERDKRPGEGTPIQEKTGLGYKSRRPVGKRSVCYKTHLYERYRLHCSMICQLWLNLSRHITRWQTSSHLMESLKSMSLKPLISLMGTYCTLT